MLGMKVQMYGMWDSAAERLRSALGIWPGETECPRVIAALCGLRLAPSRMIGAALHEDAIYYDAAAPRAEQRVLIATELGRWLLFSEGLPAIEEGARYVGMMLMVGPRVEQYQSTSQSGTLELVR